MSGYLVIDLETIGDETGIACLDEPKAPGNIKDPVKIAAAIEEKRIQQREQAGLSPDLCRIVCIGAASPGFNVGQPFTMVCKTLDDERSALEWIVAEMSQCAPIIGYNNIAFDLPVLIQRCRLLNVKEPTLALNKYRPGQVVDLAQRLCFEGAHPMRSLKFWCKRMGIPNKDVLRGSDVAGLWAAGEVDLVAAHCKADVMATTELARRLGVISPIREMVDDGVPF